MPTFIPIPISTLQTAREPPSQTYALDLDRGRIIGRVDGLKATEQAIRKALITPRWKCLVYDNQYGSELKNEITAKDASPELIETEIPRMIEDALLTDTRILSVGGFSCSFEGDACYISFTAQTIYGAIVIEEVF